MRLVSDLFCDGLGACIGSCPRDAIKIVEREAEPYDERKVMGRIVKQGENVVKAHLEHLKGHGEKGYLKEALDYLKEKGIENPLKEGSELPCGCPGSRVMDLRGEENSSQKGERARKEEVSKGGKALWQGSELRQWPVQLTLLPINAPYFDNADLLISADCVPFANANFHQDLLKGRRLVVGCPKLDDIDGYREKLTEIFKANKIKSVTVAIMEVPCCYGLYAAVEEAIKESGKDINLIKKVISVGGEYANTG